MPPGAFVSALVICWFLFPSLSVFVFPHRVCVCVCVCVCVHARVRVRVCVFRSSGLRLCACFLQEGALSPMVMSFL